MQLTGALISEIAKFARCSQVMQAHCNMRMLILDRLRVSHRIAFRPESTVQYPIDHMNRVAKQFKLVYFAIYLDPPRHMIVGGSYRRKVFDEFGRLMYMGPRPVNKKILAQDFAPLVQFQEMFTQHPDPVNATDEEKRDRILTYLDMYANSGMITPSARAVGVSYMQLIVWINEKVEFQQMAKLAHEGAKQIMVDIGRQRAMAGDSSLTRFFIESDNPDFKGKKKGPGLLPEGVTTDSISAALNQVRAAEAANLSRVLTEPDGTDGEYEGHELLLVNSPDSIAQLVNQISQKQNPFSLLTPSLASLPPRIVDFEHDTE